MWQVLQKTNENSFPVQKFVTDCQTLNQVSVISDQDKELTCILTGKL